MKKFAVVFIKGIGLGLGVGLCLAGGVAVLYRATHGAGPQTHSGYVVVYLLVVGSLMGLLGGWGLALQIIFENLLGSLFMKISELVPMPAAEVGEEWARKMETFFQEVLRPMPGFFRKFVDAFLVVRFRDYGRINRAINKAKEKEPTRAYSPQWMARVALHYFLEPFWLFFYLIYFFLFLICCVFWSLPFFKIN